jgi:hypothetical protein
MEAYFRAGRLRNGFLLCRCFPRVKRRFDALNPLDGFQLPLAGQETMIRAAGVHPTWSGEWGWEIPPAIVAPDRPSSAVTTRPAARVHRRDAFGTASLRAAAAPKDAEIDQ